MKQDPKFTEKLQQWMNTPDSQKDWSEGAMMLFQLSGNRIMYHNISINPKGKAEFIKGQLQKYLNFRLQQLTKSQVQEMQTKVDEIVEKVIKPNTILRKPSSVGANSISVSGKSEEFANFKAGKRSDHDALPAEIQALYVENLDIIHRMRELHLKLRTLSLDNATCPDSERYPFLKEIIALDKKRVSNWDVYDHFVIGVTPIPEVPAAPAAKATVPEVSETSVSPAVDGSPAKKASKAAGRKPKAKSKKTTKK